MPVEEMPAEVVPLSIAKTLPPLIVVGVFETSTSEYAYGEKVFGVPVAKSEVGASPTLNWRRSGFWIGPT